MQVTTLPQPISPYLCHAIPQVRTAVEACAALAEAGCAEQALRAAVPALRERAAAARGLDEEEKAQLLEMIDASQAQLLEMFG